MTTPLTHRCYIADENPFRLTAPPLWWLNGLAAFDADLVVIPSRQRPVYWLCRRRTLSADFSGKPLAGIDPRRDTQMFIQHKIVNVVDIACHVNEWSSSSLEHVLAWLDARDMWKEEGRPLDEHGIKYALDHGGSKVTKRIEEDERQADARTNRIQHERIYHATGDAWRSLQARAGRRILNAGMPKPQHARRAHTQPVGFAPIVGA